MELFKDVPEGVYPMIPFSVSTNSELLGDCLKNLIDHVKLKEDDPFLLIVDKHMSRGQAHVPLKF
jgi:hypothetical protein